MTDILILLGIVTFGVVLITWFIVYQDYKKFDVQEYDRKQALKNARKQA